MYRDVIDVCCWDSYKYHNCIVWVERRIFLILNLSVSILTTRALKNRENSSPVSHATVSVHEGCLSSTDPQNSAVAVN
jgi:hypothetical protein